MKYLPKLRVMIFGYFLALNLLQAQTCTISYNNTIQSISGQNWTGCACASALSSGGTVNCNLLINGVGNGQTPIFDKSFLINGNITINGTGNPNVQIGVSSSNFANMTVNGNFTLPTNNQELIITQNSSLTMTNGTLAITGSGGGVAVSGTGSIAAGPGGSINLGSATCTSNCPVITGSCTGSACTSPATCSPAPTFTSTTTGTRCGTGTVVIGATASSGTINWYTTASTVTTSTVGSGNTYTTPSISTTTTYYAGINNCSNVPRLAVTASVAGSAVGGTPVITASGASYCQNGTGIFTVSGITNATSFNWTVPSGFTITSGSGTSVIGVSFSGSASSAGISVSGSNTCSSGTTAIKAITVNPSVPTPGAISGSTTVCQSQTGISYSITTVAGNTYTWTMPTGFTVTAGAGTNSITVSIGASASSGTISVSGTNSCGTSVATTISVTTNSSISNNTISSSITICTNTSPSTISGLNPTGGSGTYTYLWESSTTSGSSGFSNANGSYTGIEYYPGILSLTTWFRRTVSSGTCATNTSNTVQITVSTSSGSWLGNTTDWNNSINWCGGILPTSTTDASIQSGVTNMPIITSDGVSIRNLTIGNGASLSIVSTLSITGNLTNSGTINPSIGSNVYFNGSNQQTINGASIFYNLQVIKSNIENGIILAGPIRISGSLTLGSNSVITTLGNDLILVSNTTTGTGRIAQLPTGADIVGNITVERFIPAKRAFRLISSPVSNATLATLQTSMYITGNGAGSDAGSTVPTVSYYNESSIGAQSNGFYGISSGITTTLTVGSGFRVLVRGDRSLSMAALGTNPTKTVMSLTGIMNKGSITIPVSITSTTGGNISVDGWNLIGNPYPSQIDWDLLSTYNNVDNAYYTYDPRSDDNTLIGSYFNYVNGVATGSRSSLAQRPNPSVIPSCQGFFIHVSTYAGASLQFTESMKTASLPTDNFKKEPISNLLYVTMENDVADDNTAIRFTHQASGNFDRSYDAYKLNGSYVNISSTAQDGSNLAINSLSEIGRETKSIPLNIASSKNGVHKLSFTNLQSFDSHIKLTLTDRYTNTVNSITEGMEYDFSITTVSGSKGNQRFFINFTPQFGSIIVNSSIASIGAKWTFDSHTWYNCGDTIKNIPTGSYEITFSDVNGYKTPSSVLVDLEANKSTSINGIYTTQPNYGSIVVKMSPSSVKKGRERTYWSINNLQWNESGTQLDKIEVGRYTVTFSDLAGYSKPTSIEVDIIKDQLVSIDADYTSTDQVMDSTSKMIAINLDTVATKANVSLTTAISSTNNGQIKISTYPIPVNENPLTIDIEGAIELPIVIEIISNNGSTIYKEIHHTNPSVLGKKSIILNDFREFTNGLYVIKLTINEHLYIRKIVK